MKTERDYLVDILDYVGKIEQFTQEGREAFYADERTQYAVIRCYEVIGEIAKRIPDAILQKQPHIPWKKIRGFRDYLAHHYEEVTLAIVWEAVEEMPALRDATQYLLNQLPPDDESNEV